MADIRLNKLTRQFNIGLQTLVDFLNEKGAGLDLNPNAKISDEFLPALEKKFGDDLRAKQDAERVDIKMKEIIERNTRRASDEEEEDYYRHMAEADSSRRLAMGEVDYQQGGDGEEAELVDAERKPKQEGDEEEPARGIGVIVALRPPQHCPDYCRGEEHREAVDFALDCREPGSVAEDIAGSADKG